MSHHPFKLHFHVRFRLKIAPAGWHVMLGRQVAGPTDDPGQAAGAISSLNLTFKESFSGTSETGTGNWSPIEYISAKRDCFGQKSLFRPIEDLLAKIPKETFKAGTVLVN